MIAVQRLAARVVARVLSGRSLDAELRASRVLERAMSPSERAAVQDISYGTLRFLGQIDVVLDALLERPLEDESVRALLRIALYQLIHTRSAAHAIVDHAVETCVLVRKARAKGLVNAVLRSFLRRREALLAAAARTDEGRYSHPPWWIEKLRVQYPADHARILDCANVHPPLTLRVNRRRSTVAQYVERLQAQGIPARALGGSAVELEKPLPVDEIPGFATGEVSVQDAAAQHAAYALELCDGLRVLDACAAPGGKTAHLLEDADLDLTALDIDAERLQRVELNLERLGLNARLLRGDAAQPAHWWDGVPYARILADVPCSASGVVRRHPDVKWLRRPSDIARYAERQQAILAALWRVLAPDGKLLYVTCSVFQDEGGMQIAHFLEHHPDARRLPLPVPHTNAQERAGQILPDQHHDGFFYALLQKI
jgi:16S rRNA (cytosine967-C5)-methyltransferase